MSKPRGTVHGAAKDPPGHCASPKTPAKQLKHTLQAAVRVVRLIIIQQNQVLVRDRRLSIHVQQAVEVLHGNLPQKAQRKESKRHERARKKDTTERKAGNAQRGNGKWKEHIRRKKDKGEKEKVGEGHRNGKERVHRKRQKKGGIEQREGE